MQYTFDQLADFTAWLVSTPDERDDDLCPGWVLGVLDAPQLADLTDRAHMPRVGRALGVMANPGSQNSLKAMQASSDPIKAAVIMSLGQGDPRLASRLCAHPDDLRVAAGLHPPPQAFGYRREGDWHRQVDKVIAADLSGLGVPTSDIVALSITRLCGVNPLIASYAGHFISVRQNRASPAQLQTPGPVRLAHDWHVNPSTCARSLTQRFGYPHDFDGSALMCEMHRIDKHLKALHRVQRCAGVGDTVGVAVASQELLHIKRPRISRMSRFDVYADFHKDVANVA